MDNSDDYFTDDIVLDDEALAVLDHVEQNFLTQAAAPLPAPKRFKTASGWKPGIRSPMGSFSELPEISLSGDGSYDLGSRLAARSSSIAAAIDAPLALRSLNTISHQTAASTSQGSRHPSRIYSHQNRPIAIHGLAHRPQRPNVDDTENRQVNIPPSGNSKEDLTGQLKEIQKKLEELRAENTKMQSALKTATEAKLLKEGEVSVLRKNMEKTAQYHSEQISKLKSAKEEADARALLAQKEAKEEMERLRTQFMFKHQELEASVRRPPPTSARMKKQCEETPIRAPRRAPVGESPVRAFANVTPEKSKKMTLPGFQNTFVAGPLKPSQPQFQYLDDDKILAVPEQMRLSNPQFRENKGVLREYSPPPSPGIQNPNFQLMLDSDGDLIMNETEENLAEVGKLETLETPNRNAELSCIILTHSLSPYPELTFQLLLGLPSTPPLTLASTEKYVEACAKLLEVLSDIARGEDYMVHIDGVCVALSMMVVVLMSTSFIIPLTALMNLLATLTHSIPNFGTSLLAQTLMVPNQADPVHILHILRDVIQANLNAPNQLKRNAKLISETLSFLTSLSCCIDDASIKLFAVILQNNGVMETLVNEAQPSCTLLGSSQLLKSLATHRVLLPPLLGFTNTIPSTTNLQSDGILKTVYIENLCSLLIDFTRDDHEFREFKICTLAFITLLIIHDTDAHLILVKYYSIIPSIVLYIFHLTTPIWEDDEQFMGVPDLIISTVRTLHQTLYLLHHLVFGLDPAFNLSQKLQQAAHRPFNGITHMFIVTFGRLSYAEPPDWLDRESRSKIEYMSAMARELLDVVVDGPEGDSVWATFQVEPDRDSDTDEGEMEASLLGAET